MEGVVELDNPHLMTIMEKMIKKKKKAKKLKSGKRE